jgi:DNA (cytosine-5)-methyltransferase 1
MPRNDRHAGVGVGHRANYLDLFCGCGGFSLGLKRAGLNCVAAIDVDPEAVATFKANFPKVSHALERDLTTFAPEELRRIIGDKTIDIIVGGPPCQGFSKVRMVDGSNHGDRLVEDPRRLLYKNYLHYVEFFKPTIFIMENVPGIRSAAGGEFFISVQEEARKLGYRVHATPVCAWHYGVPQKRERQLIIGTSCELPIFSINQYASPTHGEPDDAVNGRRPKQQRSGRGRPRKLDKIVTVWEAIGDLPPVRAGQGAHEMAYDVRRRRSHLKKFGKRYLDHVLEAHRTKSLTAHVARPHNARDLRDFARLKAGETSGAAIARGVTMEFPYDRNNFKDRYTRQRRNGLCSTIVAHLSKDGLMFIHPTQKRSLTVREAARIQSFPDWFDFPEARTTAFRLIGNAVPPTLAKAIGRGLKRYLSASRPMRKLSPMPKSPEQAVEWLTPAAGTELMTRRLRVLPMDTFKKAWFSLGFLNTWLHPDSAGDQGDFTTDRVYQSGLLGAIAPQIAVPAYASSGWPISLVPLAKEAARRFQDGRLRLDEYYCSMAHIAGWEWCKRNGGDEWGRRDMS